MSRKKSVITTDIAQRLKLIRESLGLSQREFGRRAGVSGAHVGQVESGERGVSSELLRGLPLVDASVDWLLTGEGPMLLDGKKVRAPAREEAPRDPRLAVIMAGLDEWWDKADEDERAWLRVQLRRHLPELAELAERKSR